VLFSILYLILRGMLRLVPSAEGGRDREVEILVLRHQIKVLSRKVGRPKLRRLDRVFLSAAARRLSRERRSSFLVTPATLLRWHRELVKRLSSLISELASHEVPGFGAPALPSALGLEALASALAVARDQGVSAFRPGGGEPSSAPAATCWRTKCRDVAISTRTKAPEGLESCRRGGAS